MPKPAPSPSLILATLALAVYFVGAVEFMLAPMLTPLASAFAAKPADIAWLVSAYAVSYAVLAPLIGLLSDRIGRRRLLLPALALFAADALAVAFAPSLTFAIIARVLGGVAGAALTPTAFALIAETVPEDRQAGAMGLVLFGLTLGIATGPTFAGLLTWWETQSSVLMSQSSELGVEISMTWPLLRQRAAAMGKVGPL